MPKLDLPERYRRQLLTLLDTHVPEAEVWAYGSRVRGTNHEASDLDIVLRGPQLAKLGYEYPELVEAVRESTIPILIDIFDWARLPESFHREIERNYVVLKESRPWREPQIVDERGRPTTIDIDPADRKTVLQLVERHVPNCEVRAYGPRVEWTADLYSRLDIAVMGTSDASPRALTALREAFSNSDLPFIIDVMDWHAIWDEVRQEMSGPYVVLQPAVLEDHCPISPLGEVAMINDNLISNDLGYPFINYLDTGSITKGRVDCYQRLVPNQDAIPSRARRRCRPGDIVYSTVRPNQRHYGILHEQPENLVVSTGFAVIRADELRAHTEYLYWYLTQDHIVEHLQAIAEHSTSAYPSIKASDLASVLVRLPPIEQQKQIASVLRRLDDRIELNRRMCATLEEMASALFKAWFVDFEPVRAKIEGRWREGESLPGLPAHLYDLFPGELIDSELGAVPNGWQTRRLDEIADHLRETTSPSRSPTQDFALHSIPAFDSGRSPELAQGHTILSNKCIIYPGTVLMSRLNPDIERVWFIGTQIDKSAIASTEFAVLRPKPPIDPSFLYCTLRSDRYRNALVGLVTGTSKSHQRVRPQALAATTLLVPSEPVLAEFSDIVSVWLDEVLVLRSVSQSLTSLRDTLLPKLIAGEVRLPDAPGVTDS